MISEKFQPHFPHPHLPIFVLMARSACKSKRSDRRLLDFDALHEFSRTGSLVCHLRGPHNLVQELIPETRPTILHPWSLYSSDRQGLRLGPTTRPPTGVKTCPCCIISHKQHAVQQEGKVGQSKGFEALKRARARVKARDSYTSQSQRLLK
jgi:hypothetical protein